MRWLERTPAERDRWRNLFANGGQPPIRQIVSAASAWSNVPIFQIKDRFYRDRRTLRARHVAIVVCRRFGYSRAVTCRAIGGGTRLWNIAYTNPDAEFPSQVDAVMALARRPVR